MGYTHYWHTKTEVSKDKWDKFIGSAKKVLDGSRDIIQFEDDIDEDPVADTEQIRFNGVERDGHETFLIKRVDKPKYWSSNQDEVFRFCKTARKPYDKYVTACLILAKVNLKDEIRISSDGYVSEWQEGIELLNQKLGKNYEMSGDNVETAIIKEVEVI